MVKKNVINNWSQALVVLATNSKALDLFHDQCFDIYKLFKKNNDVFIFLCNNHFTKTKRKNILDQMFKTKIHNHLLNAFKLMMDWNLFRNVKLILKLTFLKINNLNYLHYGKIYSVYPLSEGKIKEIEQKMSKKLNSKIKLINFIDKSLIGGIKIQVWNYLLDVSIQGKLKQMHLKAFENKALFTTENQKTTKN